MTFEPVGVNIDDSQQDGFDRDDRALGGRIRPTDARVA